MGSVFLFQESELRPQADSTNSGPGGESNSRCSSPVSIPEDRMEPIEEENSPKSFDRSFSFVSYFNKQIVCIIVLYSFFDDAGKRRRFKAVVNNNYPRRSSIVFLQHRFLRHFLLFLSHL